MAKANFSEYKLFFMPSPPIANGSLINIPLNQFSKSLPPNTQDLYTPAITLPFTFNFDNVDYNSCLINTNGYVVLGSSAPTNIGGGAMDQNANNLSQSVDAPVICPWWDDLLTTPDSPMQTNVDDGGVFSYSGSYGLDGHKIFAVRWRCYSQSTTGFGNTGDQNIFFECVFHKDSNVIEFNYAPYQNISSSIGISAATIGIIAPDKKRDAATSLARFRSFTSASGFYLDGEITKFSGYYLGGDIEKSVNDLTVAINWPSAGLSQSSYPQHHFVFAPPIKTLKWY